MSKPHASPELSKKAFRARWLGAAAVVVGGGVALFAFRGCSSAVTDDPDLPRPRTALDPASPHIEIPKFGKPEEARRYFVAMKEGDERALELLDKALAEAKNQASPDPVYLAELERDRAFRTARLKAHVEAQRNLDASGTEVH